LIEHNGKGIVTREAGENAVNASQPPLIALRVIAAIYYHDKMNWLLNTRLILDARWAHRLRACWTRLGWCGWFNDHIGRSADYRRGNRSGGCIVWRLWRWHRSRRSRWRTEVLGTFHRPH